MAIFLFYIIIFNLLVIGITLLNKYLLFKDSKYKESSGNGFFKTIFDKGNYGEFLTFSYLEKLDCFYKLLTNIYIPKKDGTTTEVDLVMVTTTGIYVIESKNYSGWIFGSEKLKSWTQTFKNRKKYKFFNPIWQNKGHISALKNILGIEDNDIYKSYIVFSERCELKKIELDSRDIKVLKRNDLLETIKYDIKNSSDLIDLDKVVEIYKILNKYSNVEE